MVHQLLFFVFAAICVAGAVNLLLQKHPIHSALSLIVVMGSLAVLYLLLGAPFLALIQIIVYAGAIMVLFVYVIMLLNAAAEEHSRGSRVAWLLGAPATAIGAGILIWILVRGTRIDIRIGEFVGTTDKVALLLFKDYLLPFEITSVLILIAIMGAVVLARREH
jgi:NADH-quinone oxidoreductase subunit J